MKKAIIILGIVSAITGCAHFRLPLFSAECPESHPVKGNASSRLYHTTASPYYNKVQPEWCFTSPEAARKSGYYPAKSLGNP